MKSKKSFRNFVLSILCFSFSLFFIQQEITAQDSATVVISKRHLERMKSTILALSMDNNELVESNIAKEAGINRFVNALMEIREVETIEAVSVILDKYSIPKKGVKPKG